MMKELPAFVNNNNENLHRLQTRSYLNNARKQVSSFWGWQNLINRIIKVVSIRSHIQVNELTTMFVQSDNWIYVNQVYRKICVSGKTRTRTGSISLNFCLPVYLFLCQSVFFIVLCSKRNVNSHWHFDMLLIFLTWVCLCYACIAIN